MRKLVPLILVCASSISMAQTSVPNRDEFAQINSGCAAFYDLLKEVVKPEVRRKYVDKFNMHKLYAKQLHESTESVESRYESDFASKKLAFTMAQSEGSLNQYLSKEVLGCASVEMHTPLVIQAHNFKLNR